ncbi:MULTISPECIES: hypothetical protein [Bacillus]|uniref:hypothetical protein n=1 Tax=Bacillus TaxID=1386 RepID=UPI000D03D14B|nr:MULTISPECIES: hypothetical protein [Bacillus]PRS28783.1 hypothetical protein C6X99_14090 [Bacillus pumilus]PRS56118.1 hypothetical protein C6Y06_03905 [Bacillus sp. MZGC1]PRS63498.1 hypothetical protein C6X97_07165 [Bacillus pumilus]PRS68403.1 hypothetical protein C6X98_02525 [Bacillus pumilus]
MSFTKPTSLSFAKSTDDEGNQEEHDFQRNLRLGILTLNEVRAHYGLKPIGEIGNVIYKRGQKQ